MFCTWNVPIETKLHLWFDLVYIAIACLLCFIWKTIESFLLEEGCGCYESGMRVQWEENLRRENTNGKRESSLLWKTPLRFVYILFVSENPKKNIFAREEIPLLSSTDDYRDKWLVFPAFWRRLIFLLHSIHRFKIAFIWTLMIIMWERSGITLTLKIGNKNIKNRENREKAGVFIIQHCLFYGSCICQWNGRWDELIKISLLMSTIVGIYPNYPLLCNTPNYMWYKEKCCVFYPHSIRFEVNSFLQF